MISTAITEAITTIAEAEKRFQLSRNEANDFFTAWQDDRSEVTERDRADLAILWQRYVYQRSRGHLLENTIMLILISPLLALGGLYDDPFQIKAEESIKITVSDGEEILQGRIDALVITDRFWVIVVESKRSMLSLWSALPQALAYLMANPNPEYPVFGMLTNGDEMVFIQMKDQKYAFSRVFSPLVAQSDLEAMLISLRSLVKKCLTLVGSR